VEASAKSLLELRHLTTLTTLTLKLGNEDYNEEEDEDPMPLQMTDDVLRALASLVQLRSLSIYDCFSPATNRGIQELGALTGLTYLELGLGSTVSDDWLGMLRNLISLNTLHLNGRMIHGTAAREWSSLTALTSLKLVQGVTNDGARAVCTLTSLTSLNIGNCNALSTVDDMSNLHAMRTLNLSYCNMLSGVSGLSNCTALRTLNFSCCSELIDVSAVSSCTALTSVDLSLCSVTDEGVLPLRSLPALIYLDLCYNAEVTAAGIQALRSTTAAPNLHIKSGSEW
jgi:internalin A